MQPVSRSRFLDIARALALVSPLAACGGTAPLANSGGEGTNAAPSASTSAPVKEGGADPTAGSGPCRCSWNSNAAAAPRVCKKGEPSYEGAPCIPGNHPSYEGGMMPPIGPLAPPELG